jgi:hypothetical protein
MIPFTHAAPLIFMPSTPVLLFALTFTQSRALRSAADYNVGMFPTHLVLFPSFKMWLWTEFTLLQFRFKHGPIFTHYSAINTQDFRCEEWREKCTEQDETHSSKVTGSSHPSNMHQHKNTKSNYPSILFQPWIPV